MHVTCYGTLRAGFPEQVRVTRIETLNRRAFVTSRERRYQVVAEPEEEDVTVERRPILFAYQRQCVRILSCDGVFAAAGLEVHPVENAVVLVRDELVED